MLDQRPFRLTLTDPDGRALLDREVPPHQVQALLRFAGTVMPVVRAGQQLKQSIDEIDAALQGIGAMFQKPKPRRLPRRANGGSRR